VVSLTIVIGTLNLCLGYALAVYLGYGPTTIREMPAGTSQATTQVMAMEDSIEDVVGQLMAAPIEQMLDDDPDDDFEDELEVEAYAAPGQESDDDEPINPDAPENWELDEKNIEISILKLNIAMMKSGARATNIDTQLRACQGHSDKETVQDCLSKLKEDCEAYLNELGEMAAKFSSRIGEMGELSELGEEIEIANLEQAAQVETTLSNLEFMDFGSDLEAANLRLLEEISNLRMARHKQRDNQEMAFVAVAQHQNRLQQVEPRLFNDPLTRLYNRIGIEATLDQWWQQGYPNSRQISAVLFDLDGFSELNEKLGPSVGDRILFQVASFIQEKAGKLDLVGRFAGQQFLVVMLDIGPRTATKNAELIRQSIEKIVFKGNGKEINVTVAGGITEIKPEDTRKDVLERLQKTLRDAKQAGPNQSFFHDGEEAELVESPNLGAQYVELQI